MRKQLSVISALTILIAASFVLVRHLKGSHQATQSPYVNQLSSSVRGLSAQEIDDLLNGRGMGYARTAELNGYPGPLHILELEEKLELSTEQAQKIEAVFQEMNTEAKRIGKEIIEHEEELSTLFADGEITATELRMRTESLAALDGELRATHLEAHLKATPVLSSEQITAYNTLRGYTERGYADGGSHNHEHHHTN